MTPTALRPGDPDRVGTYRLVNRLGSGGMGEVFLGRSAGGRPVAVKLLHSQHGSDEMFRRAFASEVEAARRVGGFFTAQVVDADAYAERPWLVTAYVPGPSLSAAVERGGGLPSAAVWVLGAGLAEGLAAIHTCGLVHRDLKPSNVIVAADGPRVIDFGIARALEITSRTATGAVVGTPAYMSPEQARGDREIGYASDVYSLGSVLAFAATGECPVGDGHPAALIYRIIHETPNLSDVPGDLRELVTACLTKDPARRPAVADILRWCSDRVDSTDGWLLPSTVTDMIGGSEAVLPETRVDLPQTGAPPAEERPRRRGLGQILRRWLGEPITSTPAIGVRPLTEGWNGLAWGATVAAFQRRFPDAGRNGDWWLTGHGPEEFCGVRMTAQYAFNDRGKLYTVTFLPEVEDRERLPGAAVNELGPPDAASLHWTIGDIEVSIKVGAVAVSVTHRRLAPSFTDLGTTTSGTTRDVLATGWNGVAWGATTAEFRRLFPDAHQRNGEWWVTGTGPEMFCGIAMDAQYSFNGRGGGFYLVAFYPESGDRERLPVAALNELGAPDGTGTEWRVGDVEVSIKVGGMIALVTHQGLAG